MKERKMWTRKVSYLGVAFWLGLCACGESSTGAEAWSGLPEPAGTVALPLSGGNMYDESVIVDFQLSFTSKEWKRFLKYREEGSKSYVHCSFSFAGQTFSDAACRSKGGEESWEDELKPQFVISFNHWNKQGRFLGLRHLNLEANPYLAAPVRDRLGMWLMREAGLKAPRVNHARVFLNGSYLGLYQNIEAIDKEFLEDHFDDPEGNLYKEGWVLETNEEENDQEHLWALEDLIDHEKLTGDHSGFYAALGGMMDVPEVLRLMAAETVLPTSDNFSNGSWNYYYYDDPGTGRFMVLPWDFDDIIGEYAPPNADIFAYWGGAMGHDPNKLRQLMNQHPGWRQQFVENLVALRDGVYARLPEQTARYCAQIRPAFAMDPNTDFSLQEFDADCADIQQRIRARITWLRQQLGR
ncbi:CotH kinase family protein [Hyalangium versicolor]|uniref:CotH kinase family protein n=1 Tax=Hyalangium versicolor TaxID=2861190 RepID=UPI001CC9A91F|nr:CotH kinase family protein [Hyalangium versicolor]